MEGGREVGRERESVREREKHGILSSPPTTNNICVIEIGEILI